MKMTGQINTMGAASHEDTMQGVPPRGPADGDRSIAMHGNRIDSRNLFSSGREITIAHGEDTYRLRLTSQNKLILTK
jgi:hemin uptake protein HemP